MELSLPYFSNYFRSLIILRLTISCQSIYATKIFCLFHCLTINMIYFHCQSKDFDDYVSLKSCDGGFRCSGIIVVKFTNFKIAQEISNLLIEKLEHSVRIEFKLERSEEALRMAHKKASTGAVVDAKMKAQNLAMGSKPQMVSVKQLEEVEKPFRDNEINKDPGQFHWVAEIDKESLVVLCKVQVSFKS